MELLRGANSPTHAAWLLQAEVRISLKMPPYRARIAA